MSVPVDYVMPDESSPSETFVNVPTFGDVFQGDVYLFLQEALRVVDETQGTSILERWCQRPQELLERWQQKAWRATRVQHPVMTPDSLVEHLLMLVGFGKGSGLAEEIAKRLGKTYTRKLISLAVPYWVSRGRRDTLNASIRIVCGLRPLIEDWFLRRTLCDEAFLGAEGTPCDTTLEWSSMASLQLYTGGMSNDTLGYAEHEVGIIVPGLCSDSEGRQLVLDLCELARPLGERYLVEFVSFVDLFYEGVLSHWVAASGLVTSLIASPGVSSDDYVASAYKLPGLQVPALARHQLFFTGSGGQPSTLWANYLWSFLLRIESADVVARLRFYAQQSGDHYRVDVDPTNTQVLVSKSVSGVVTVLATIALPEYDVPSTRQVDISVWTNPAGTNTTIQVRLDFDVLTTLDDPDITSGTVELDHGGGADSYEVQRMILTQHSLYTSEWLKP